MLPRHERWQMEKPENLGRLKPHPVGLCLSIHARMTLVYRHFQLQASLPYAVPAVASTL